MVRSPSPTVIRFKDRVEWIIENLDANPEFLPTPFRFPTQPSDILEALQEAHSHGLYRPRGGPRSKKTWQRAVNESKVSEVFIDWLCVLFPDLSREHLLSEDYADFLAQGATIQRCRGRWKEAVNYFAENRSNLASIAKSFYKQVDCSPEFPLLTQPGWIRSTPLRLKQNSEMEWLNLPRPGRKFTPIKLDGLMGDYMSYKGSLSYRHRRAVKIEPQHNGEIFCVDRVLLQEGDFVGFDYSLAQYYDYVNTCEPLGAELADWLLRSQNHSRLPEAFRFRGTPNDAWNFQKRAYYPGINCLSIFLNYEEKGKLPYNNYFLLHKRDETQLQAQNSVHVLPAGGHQPFAKGPHIEDASIFRTVVREFFEELFDKEQLYKQPESWEDFLTYPEVKRFFEVFFVQEPAATKVYLLGFGLDPITLKPEVLVLIIVDWNLVCQRLERPQLKFNWEVQLADRKGTRHQWVCANREELERQANGGVQSLGDRFLDTLPAGAACLKLAAQHYDFFLKNTDA